MYRDWTLWAAAAFGMAPDLASVGLTFAMVLLDGQTPSFHGIPSNVFVYYQWTHSLVIAALGVLLLRLCWRPLALPALAWPLHILGDMLTHGPGMWRTPVLFPVSQWYFHGRNWWEHGWVLALYWGGLPLLWLALALVRRRHAAPAPGASG